MNTVDESSTTSFGLGQIARAVPTLARHPDLWLTALHQAAVLATPGWWRRRPYLPSPPERYLAFRLQTAYGTSDGPIDPDDLVTYLRWRRAWPHVTR